VILACQTRLRFIVFESVHCCTLSKITTMTIDIDKTQQ